MLRKIFDMLEEVYFCICKGYPAQLSTAISAWIIVAIIISIGSMCINSKDETLNKINNFINVFNVRKLNIQATDSKSLNKKDAWLIINGYLSNLSSATQHGNFKKAARYLQSMTDTYNSQESQVIKLYKSGTTKELLDVYIISLQQSSNFIKISTFEKYKVTYGNRGSKFSDNFCIYYLQKSTPHKIVQIYSTNNKYSKTQQKAVTTRSTTLYTSNYEIISKINLNENIIVFPLETFKDRRNNTFIMAKHNKFGIGWININNIRIDNKTVKASHAKRSTNQQVNKINQTKQKTQNSTSKSAKKKILTNDEEQKYNNLLKQYNLLPNTTTKN